jgi:LacI family transcriptional regulator
MTVALYDVAEQAGVSLATASKAIRGKPEIAAETRQEVLRIAAALGYKPNASARALVLGRSDTLAVAIREIYYITSPYIGAVVGGVIDVADSKNMRLLFTRTGHSIGNESEFIHISKEGRHDGMVIIDQAVSEAELKELFNLKVPAVLVDRKIAGDLFPVVRVDYRKAVQQATSYLIELGHRRIGVITPSTVLYELKEKVAGFVLAFEEHKMKFDQNLMRSGEGKEWNLDQLGRDVNELLNLPEPPTAILCLQDIRTMPLCHIIWMRGLRIPDDISVIGFDSSDPNVTGTYGIAVIRVPGFEIGVQSCRLLLNLISKKAAPKEVVLDAPFDPSGSCAPPGRHKK